MSFPRKTVLDSGIRLVSEHIPHARTVSFGIWVDVGARDEHDLSSGISHFVEHMLFKGTQQRDASRIAMELDVLGGTANAFTGKDATCFYATVLDSQLPRLLELFADIVLFSLLDSEEVRRERQVILQEISMVEDTPEEQIHELFEKLLWGHHPLGNTILGSMEVVGRMDRQKLREHLRHYYCAERIVIAAAGNVEHDELRRQIETLFPVPRASVAASCLERKAPQEVPLVQRVFSKPLEQAHIVLGTYGLDVHSKERYALMLLNIVLGGNMSSRLFQQIREKRGLAYSVHSYLDSYQDSGYLAIYLGVHPHNVNQAMRVIGDELRTLCHEEISVEDLTNARDYARAGLFLAAENMEMRMTRLARNELYYGREITYDEVLAGLEAVKREDISLLARGLLAQGMTSALLGPLREEDVENHFPAGFSLPRSGGGR